MIYKALAVLALLAAIVFGVNSFLEHERDIGRNEVRAEWALQKLADKAAAEKIEKEWRTKYDTAVNQGSKNVQALRTAVAVAGSANVGLLDTIAELNKQLAVGSTDTARQHAAAYQAVFADCVGKYRGMAEAAQGHANDARTLSEAWPK